MPNRAYKKLVFFAESASIGGDSKYLYELVNCLIDKGYSIKCFCNPILEKYLTEKIDKRIPVEVVQTKHAEYPVFYANKSKFIVRKIRNIFRMTKIIHFQYLRVWYIVHNILIIYRIFKKEKFEILHINNGGYPAAEACIAAAFAAKITGAKKIFITVHSLARERYKYVAVLEKMIDRLVAKSICKIIVATAIVKKSLVEKRGFSEVLIDIIPNGVIPFKLQEFNNDIRKEFNVSHGIKILINCGRFDGTKGQEYLLEAISLLKDKYENFKCLFIGEGTTKDNMVLLSKHLDVHPFVVFTGYRNDVHNFLNKANILIQPSVSVENFPYSVLEAMSCGVPVIGTTIGGIPEMIEDGVTGLLVPPKDSKALCNAIYTLLENEKISKKIGLAGKERVFGKYSFDSFIIRTIKIYNGSHINYATS